MLIYVIVTTAAQAYGGDRAIRRKPGRRAVRVGHAGVRLAVGQDPDNRGADLGGGLDADDDPADRAHVALDGARQGDPGEVRRGPPALLHAVLLDDLGWASCSIVWYVGLTIVSENILFDSIAALGLMIAFYYGLTGFACAIYYRKELTKSAKNFFFIGICPLIGAGILTGILVQGR